MKQFLMTYKNKRFTHGVAFFNWPPNGISLLRAELFRSPVIGLTSALLDYLWLKRMAALPLSRFGRARPVSQNDFISRISGICGTQNTTEKFRKFRKFQYPIRTIIWAETTTESTPGKHHPRGLANTSAACPWPYGSDSQLLRPGAAPSSWLTCMTQLPIAGGETPLSFKRAPVTN